MLNESNTISRAGVKAKFDLVGVGNECKISYVTAQNSSYENIRIGILKSYDMDSLKCEVIIDGKEESFDMNYVGWIIAYTEEEKLKDAEKAREKEEAKAKAERLKAEKERADAEKNKAWETSNVRLNRLILLQRYSSEIYLQLNNGTSPFPEYDPRRQFNNITLEDLDYYKSLKWDASYVLGLLKQAELAAKENTPSPIDEETVQICKRLADPYES